MYMYMYIYIYMNHTEPGQHLWGFGRSQVVLAGASQIYSIFFQSLHSWDEENTTHQVFFMWLREVFDAAECRQNGWWNPFRWVWDIGISSRWYINGTLGTVYCWWYHSVFCSVSFAPSNATAMVRTSNCWSQTSHFGQLEWSWFNQWLKWVKVAP